MEAQVVDTGKNACVVCDPAYDHTAMLVLEWIASQTSVTPGLRVKITQEKSARTATCIYLISPNYSPMEYAHLCELVELADYINSNNSKDAIRKDS